MGKVILDCELMKTRDSGLYYYCLNLGMAMNELLKNDGDQPVKFYVPSQEANTFKDPTNTIVEKPFHKFFKPFLLNCKVWHRPFQLGRIIPANKKDVKILLTVHDLNMLHQNVPAKETEEAINNTRQLIQRSDAIVCVSEFSKNDVLQHCDVGNKPVYVIHNGVNRLEAPMLLPTSYKPSRPFLLSIGFVNPKKNLHSLLRLLKFNQDIELVIAGRLDDLDYVKKMKEEANQNGFEERLKILGPVKESEKSWYLENCLAYMHPSFAEGFGLPVVEAMHFGKPLFLSKLTSLPEIGGDVAFYFTNFESHHMQEVFTKGMQRYHQNAMSGQIKERSNKFGWQESAEKYIEVYQSLF